MLTPEEIAQENAARLDRLHQFLRTRYGATLNDQEIIGSAFPEGQDAIDITVGDLGFLLGIAERERGLRAEYQAARGAIEIVAEGLTRILEHR